MHDVSVLWREIFAKPNHRKEVMVKVNGVEYHEDRILYPPPSVVGKLFDAPSVGNARSRTLTLNLMPYDGPQGHIPPMSEILLFVRLKSADGERVSEYTQKGVFYADEVRRDSVTGATRITAFDAMMKMERQFGNAVCRITFDDGFGGIQRFVREIGDAMPAPETPTHDGERFLAWYPNPADTQSVVRDMLFTANWTQKFTVTFDSGNGMPQTFSVFNGDATPTPTTPTKSRYLFTEWTPTPAATVTADATYTAQWEELRGDVTGGGDWWTATSENGYRRLYIHCNGAMPDYYLEEGEAESPSSVEPDRPYGYMSSYDELIITNSVTSIGTSAFRVDGIEFGPNYLRISIGDNVRSIGDCAFSYTVAVGTLKIPDSVTHIGDYAFYNAGGENLILSDNLTEIGNSAFSYFSYIDSSYNPSPSHLLIPGSVRRIGFYAFYEICASSVSIMSKLQYIGDLAFSDLGALDSEFVPPAIDGSNLEFVGLRAFGKSIGGELVVPQSIELSVYAFSGTKITSVTLSQGLAVLPSGAFANCENLTRATFLGGMTEITDNTFYNCISLSSVTLSEGLTDIFHAFEGCASLESVTIPASVTSIRSLQESHYGDTNGPYGTFEGCSSLRNVTFSGNSALTLIGENTFRNCSSLDNVSLPDGVTSINSVFVGCTSLTNVTLPAGLTNMESAFKGCASLTSMTLPNSVSRMSNAFEDCANLASISVQSDALSVWGLNYAFKNCANLREVILPASAQAEWTNNWIRGTFYGCTRLTSVTIPDGVVMLYDTFHGCENLRSVALPASVRRLHNYDSYRGSHSELSFSGCEALTDIYYGGTEEQWNSIEKYAPNSAYHRMCWYGGLTYAKYTEDGVEKRRWSIADVQNSHSVTIHFNSSGPT